MDHNYQNRIRKIVLTAAEAAKQEMVANGAAGSPERMTLFVKPCSNTEDGMLRMFPQSVTPPPCWKPAGADHLDIDIPYEKYFTWIHARAGSLPLLAPEYGV